MEKAIAFLRSLVATPLLIARALVLLALPLLLLMGALVGSSLIYGSGGSLDEACEVRSGVAWTIEALAPRRFWTEQVESLDRRIATIEDEPRRLALEVDELQRAASEAMAQVRNQYRDQRTEAQRAADALRAEADRIERAEAMKHFEQERLATLEAVRACRRVAVAKRRAN